MALFINVVAFAFVVAAIFTAYRLGVSSGKWQLNDVENLAQQMLGANAVEIAALRQRLQEYESSEDAPKRINELKQGMREAMPFIFNHAPVELARRLVELLGEESGE